MPDETPAAPEPKPEVLSELHRMTWQMLLERAARHSTRMQLLEAQAASTNAEIRKSQEDLKRNEEKMRVIYGLSDGDVPDLETGAIKRAPKPAPAPGGTP